MHKEIDLEFELHAYVDGDLDDEDMARVEAYLSKNPETAVKVREYLRQKDDLRGFARAQLAADEPPAFRALGKKLARRLRLGNFFPWRRAMVMPLLFAAGWVGHVFYVPIIEGPGYTHEILQAHELMAGDLAEILPISEERVAKLFSRIGEEERIPDLRQFGLKPIGAQLLPSDEGLVLHVPYRDNTGAIVSYFLLHDQDEAEVPRHVLHKEGATIVYWQHDHSRYAITSSLTEEQLSSIAAFLDSPEDSFTELF